MLTYVYFPASVNYPVNEYNELFRARMKSDRTLVPSHRAGRDGRPDPAMQSHHAYELPTTPVVLDVNNLYLFHLTDTVKQFIFSCVSNL